MKNNSCEIKSVSSEPKEESAGLTAQYILFDVWGKSLERFGKILKHISALSVNTTLSNEIEVSLTVPYVIRVGDHRNKAKQPSAPKYDWDDYDPYNIDRFSNAEDFYDDNWDYFMSYEDAEDYFNEHENK